MDNESRFGGPDEGDVEAEGLRILGSDPEDVDDVPDVDLPHWTEPGTSEVPAIGDELDAWSALGSSEPRWRDESSDYDDFDDLRLVDEPTGTAPPPPSGFGDEYGDEGGGFFGDYPDQGEPAFDEAPSEFGAVPVVPADVPGPPDSGVVPRTSGRDMPSALIVGVALGVLALAAFALGKAATVGLVTVVLVLAAAELFMNLRAVGYQPATLLGIVATGAAPLAVYWRGEPAMPLVLVLSLVFGLLWYLTGVGSERPVPNLAVTLFGIVYIGILGSFAALMLKAPNGIGMVTAAVIVTVAYDVGGFFVGRSIGSSPLSAASPNKTLEGLAGGCLAALASAVIIVGIVGLTPFGDDPGGLGDAVLLGLVAAVVAPLGDLCESLIKRDLGIKDMGSILPGHGGLLDRFDALLFVLPATYYLVRLLDLF